MSLTNNIGIGKEIYNPFHYYHKEDWEWVKELRNHKLFPDTVWPDCSYSLSTQFSDFVHLYITLGIRSYSLFFEPGTQYVEANKILMPYLKYLHDLYPGSLLAKRNDKVYLSYKPEGSRLQSLVKRSICEEIL